MSANADRPSHASSDHSQQDGPLVGPRPGSRRSAIRLAVMLLVLIAGWRGMTSEPAAQATAAARMSSPPTEQELFGEELSPYSGMGAVWIRPDGMVFIEAEEGSGTAFSIQTSSLSLVQVDGERVEFRHESQAAEPGVEVLHAFASPPPNPEQGRACSAVYRHVGDLSIDYDEETGILLIDVIGGKEIFEAAFDLSLMSQPSGQAGGSCECSYYGPPGGSCSASKTCPEGQECSCKCDQLGCKCGPCKRARGAEVQVVY